MDYPKKLYILIGTDKSIIKKYAKQKKKNGKN